MIDRRLKRLALVLATALVSLGIIFVVLDILDIVENYTLHLPIPLLNILFVCLVAFFAAYFAARAFIISGSSEILGLGCATLAFGFGSLLYSLLYWRLADAGLNVRITANDSAILVASVAHLLGACLTTGKYHPAKSETRIKQRIIFSSYPGVLAIIGFVTWLASRGIITSFLTPLADIPLLDTTIAVRDVIRITGVVLCLGSAFLYFRIYFRLHSDFYYWYFLGLILFAFGVVFISQGSLESLVAWIGRVCQYIGGTYFLVSVLIISRRV